MSRSSLRYEWYCFRDLQAAGIVESRTDLSLKIRHGGFPRPVKAGEHMSAPAFWRKSSVHAWLDKAYPESPAKAG
jgi:predicted DNA-binding transcriptional regulator AlpA